MPSDEERRQEIDSGLRGLQEQLKLVLWACIPPGYVVSCWTGEKDHIDPPVSDIVEDIIGEDWWILVHSHPNSNCPSIHDDEVTMAIAWLSDQIGTPLVDHWIFGDEGFFSYAEERPEYLCPSLFLMPGDLDG